MAELLPMGRLTEVANRETAYSSTLRIGHVGRDGLSRDSGVLAGRGAVANGRASEAH